MAQAIASLTDGDRTAELLGIAWASALGSAVVDSIPFTAAMIPVVESLRGGGDDPSPAAGLAARAGRPIGFMYFLRIGTTTMLASMVLVTAYLALRCL